MTANYTRRTSICLREHPSEFEVWITTSDPSSRLPLFASKMEGIRTASAYIASQAGMQFCIGARNSSNYDMNFSVLLDGQRMGSWVLQRSKSAMTDGVRTSDSTIRPFEFALLQVADMDDEDGFSQVDVAKLGLIEIQFHRTALRGLYPAIDSRGGAELLSSAPVSERSKKVGWHRTALGEEKTVNLDAYVHSDLIDPLESPYLTFLIRYQPADLLRARGIVPSTEHGVGNPCSVPGPSSNIVGSNNNLWPLGFPAEGQGEWWWENALETGRSDALETKGLKVEPPERVPINMYRDGGLQDQDGWRYQPQTRPNEATYEQREYTAVKSEGRNIPTFFAKDLI